MFLNILLFLYDYSDLMYSPEIKTKTPLSIATRIVKLHRSIVTACFVGKAYQPLKYIFDQVLNFSQSSVSLFCTNMSYLYLK